MLLHTVCFPRYLKGNILNHKFDINHAAVYGLHEAILIANFGFWIQKNIDNGQHFHDGRTWTYNSVSAFELVYPYFSYKQIRVAIDKLIKKGVLLRGRYNIRPSDRTSWFAFTDEFLASNPLPFGANSCAPQGRPSALKDKSLIYTDITTDKNHISLFDQAWEAYPDRPGKSKANSLKAWNARLNAGHIADEMLAGTKAYAAYCKAVDTDSGYIKQPETFFGPGEHFKSDWKVPPGKHGVPNMQPGDIGEIPDAY